VPSGLRQPVASISIAGRQLAPPKRLKAVALLSQMPSQQLPFPTVLDLVSGLVPSEAHSEVFAQLKSWVFELGIVWLNSRPRCRGESPLSCYS